MTSKGQITVPKDVRLRLGLKPGDRVRFIVESDGRVRLLPAREAAPPQQGRASFASPSVAA